MNRPDRPSTSTGPPRSRVAPFATASSRCVQHALELPLADQRPELRPGVHRVAEADRRRAVEQPSQVLRVDAAVHVHALDRSARLAGAGGARPQRSSHGAVEIGVVAHDRRVVAPELEDDALAVLGRETPDALAVGDPAREADLRDGRRPADRLPGRAGAVDDAQHAVWQAGLGEHRGKQVPAERRVLGRLRGRRRSRPRAPWRRARRARATGSSTQRSRRRRRAAGRRSCAACA